MFYEKNKKIKLYERSPLIFDKEPSAKLFRTDLKTFYM